MTAYQELIEQYNKLSDKEQNALLVYKTRLGRAINSLDNNEEEVENIYEQYKILLENPKNMFMLLTVFNSISFLNLEDFKKVLKI